MESVLIFGVMLILGLVALFIVSPLIIGALFLIETVASFIPISTKDQER